MDLYNVITQVSFGSQNQTGLREPCGRHYVAYGILLTNTLQVIIIK